MFSATMRRRRPTSAAKPCGWTDSPRSMPKGKKTDQHMFANYVPIYYFLGWNSTAKQILTVSLCCLTTYARILVYEWANGLDAAGENTID